MTLKIHVYQDKDPPEILYPPDEEIFGTPIRSLTDLSIYTVKSSKSHILQVQSVCTIFGLDYNTSYIETVISSLNSSQSESGFCKKHFIVRRFRAEGILFRLDNSGEFKFDAKNPYLSR